MLRYCHLIVKLLHIIYLMYYTITCLSAHIVPNISEYYVIEEL
jgi:hypothetical protein